MDHGKCKPAIVERTAGTVRASEVSGRELFNQRVREADAVRHPVVAIASLDEPKETATALTPFRVLRKVGRQPRDRPEATAVS